MTETLFRQDGTKSSETITQEGSEWNKTKISHLKSGGKTVTTSFEDGHEVKVRLRKDGSVSSKTITEADGKETKITYRKKKDKDGNTKTVEFTNGSISSEIISYPDNTFKVVRYDEQGEKTEETTFLEGDNKEEVHFEKGKKTKEVITRDGKTTDYWYYPDGKTPIEVIETDRNGVRITTDYRLDGTKESVSCLFVDGTTKHEDGMKITNTYHSDGKTLAQNCETDKDGNTVTKCYDENGNFSGTIMYNKKKAVTVQYDINGKMQSLEVKNYKGKQKKRTGLRAKLSAALTGTRTRLPKGNNEK